MLGEKEQILLITDINAHLMNLSFEDENIIFRFLEEDDYNKNYFDLLSNLTSAPNPRFEDWREQFNKIKKSPIFIFVIEDKSKSLIVGSITCLIESKFIRNLGKVSHIEDVVVHLDYRNKKFGSKLVNIAVHFSKKLGCYKIILDARDDAMGFYQRLGFEKRSEGMALYL